MDYRDVLIHSIMLLGINADLRYDEVRKIKISHVTVVTGQFGTVSDTMTITEDIKTSTKPREYI